MTRADRSRLPALGPDPRFRFPAVNAARLSNGLTIRTVERRDLPVVTLLLVLPVGAAADPGPHFGLASLTGDMLDEGSGAWSAIDVQDALARIGAQLDIEVGSDATTVVLTALSARLERALHLLAEVVVRPALRDGDVARVRTLWLHRLRQLRDSPSACADRLFIESVYRGHPYGHLSGGSERTIETIVRAQVVAFHEREYRASRATVVAVGDFSHEALVNLVGRALGSWEGAADARAPVDPAAVAAPDVAATRILLLDRPGAPQSELRIGHAGLPRRTPDFHALLVMNTLLGGHFASRINLNLRERKGCTYSARTAFEFRRGPGPFLFQASVQTSATAEAIKETLDEIDAIGGRRPATPAETVTARATLTRGFPRNFETTPQVARAIAQLVLYDLPEETFEQFAPRVNDVPPEQATDVARRHLHPDRSLIVVVGDRSAIESELRALGVGEPVDATLE